MFKSDNKSDTPEFNHKKELISLLERIPGEGAYLSYAKKELSLYFKDDISLEDNESEIIKLNFEYAYMMTNNILDTLHKIREQGHSGSSIHHFLRLLTRLAKFEPLTPLTGEDDEWMNVGDGYYQNVRCSNIFKKDGEPAYTIDGIVFEDEDGCRFTNSESRVAIEFPYLPQSPKIVKRYNTDKKETD